MASKKWKIIIFPLKIDIMGLIYETNVRPKFGRTVVSTQNLEFIQVSGGYDQISRQVWARVHKFLSQLELACSIENFD